MGAFAGMAAAGEDLTGKGQRVGNAVKALDVTVPQGRRSSYILSLSFRTPKIIQALIRKLKSKTSDGLCPLNMQQRRS